VVERFGAYIFHIILHRERRGFITAKPFKILLLFVVFECRPVHVQGDGNQTRVLGLAVHEVGHADTDHRPPTPRFGRSAEKPGLGHIDVSSISRRGRRPRCDARRSVVDYGAATTTTIDRRHINKRATVSKSVCRILDGGSARARDREKGSRTAGTAQGKNYSHFYVTAVMVRCRRQLPCTK